MVALDADIQRRRIQAAALALVSVRALEGVIGDVVLVTFYARPVHIAPALVHITFAIYILANIALYVRHRRADVTEPLILLDIVANVVPICLAMHWSGGIHSPLLPLLAVKIAVYTVLYGVRAGWQSLTVVGMGLLVVFGTGRGWIDRGPAVAAVPLPVRQRLNLVFELFAYGIMVGAGLRFFRMLQDRERRLASIGEERAELLRTAEHQQDELRRLSRKMMRVSEHTMRRVARELHDDLGQALTAVKINLGMVERQLDADSAERTRVAEAREQIGAVLQEVRTLSQLLRPAVLDDLGLVAAIKSYVARFGERVGVDVALDLPPAEMRLPRPLEVALYRVLQEALTNVARHAGAHRVDVSLRVDGERADLQIADDGCGFDATAQHGRPAGQAGMGIIGMRERVAAHEGDFAIESQAGGGTKIVLSVPLTQSVQDPEEDHGEDSRPGA